MQNGSDGLVGTLLSLPIFEAEWVLWLLIVLSVASVAVMIERVVFLQRHKVDIDAVRSKLDALLAKDNIGDAALYLRGFDSLETNVVLFGIRDADKGADSVEELINGAQARETERYNSRLSFLATTGSNAPFIGLFGTVLGIIHAFAVLNFDLGKAGGQLMGAISEALVATGVGLFVAIPAVVAYNWLVRVVESRAAGAELLSRTLLAYLRAEQKAS